MSDLEKKATITVTRDTFLKKLSPLSSLIERRSHTIPILSHILLDAAGDRLSLTVTDLELSIMTSLPAAVRGEGRTTVSARLLCDIVQKLNGSEVKMEFQKDSPHLYLNCQRSRFRLASLPAEGYPVIQLEDLPYRFQIPSTALVKILKSTQFAMSEEESRYTLNGVYVHRGVSQTLRAVATDGHRLAQRELPLPEGAQEIPGVILSRKTVRELVRLLPEDEELITISLSGAQITFTYLDLLVTARLIDGSFPDYERVIPLKNDKMLRIEGRDFFEAMSRVSLVLSQKNQGIQIALDQGKVQISATNGEIGSAVEEVEAHYEGEPLEIGFNASYLMDITSQIKKGLLEVTLSDSGSPVTVREQGDPHTLFVVMPMRL